MLLITPMVAELERLYKGAEIDIVGEGELACDIFATFFSVKNVYCLPRRGFKHPASFLSLILKVRKTRYDLIIDPCVGSGFSRTLTRIFKGRYKLGFGDVKVTHGLTHHVPRGMAPKHMAKRSVYLARWHASLNATESPGFPTLDIRLTEDERAHGRSVVQQLLDARALGHASRTIGIFADATGRKRYPVEWWMEFIASLQNLMPQTAIVEIVPMHGTSMLDSAWPTYYSSSIRRMAAVMSSLDIVISADCGVMHLAVAAHVPTIGMFSVTDANTYGPYGVSNSWLVTNELSASDAAQRVADGVQRARENAGQSMANFLAPNRRRLQRDDCDV